MTRAHGRTMKRYRETHCLPSLCAQAEVKMAPPSVLTKSPEIVRLIAKILFATLLQ